MQTLKNSLHIDSFFDTLGHADRGVLMLDYDGTLAPFQVRRDQAVPFPGVREKLTEIICAEKTHVVIITGRAVKELTPLLALDRLPEIWGSHGAEQLTADGRYRVVASDELPAEGLAEIYWWARGEGLLSISEKKPVGIAFHWRGMPNDEISGLKEKIQRRWQNDASKFGLELREFDGGIELRVAGITKADAVTNILARSGKDAVMAYLGDDTTDEDAFQALSGRGLSVLVREELRETGADVWIRPPEELLAFLDSWAHSAGRRP